MSIRNSLLVLLFGGTLGMFLLREQQRGTLEPFDEVHRKFLKANTGPPEPPPANESSVILGRLDDADQPNRVFATWPLGERDWQNILQNLPAFTPKTTAIAAPLPFDKAGPGLTGVAAAQHALLVPAAVSASPGDGASALPDGLPVLTVRGSASAIPEFKSIKPPPIPGIAAAGDIDMLSRDRTLTVDGDWCRVPMLARLGDKVVPSLALRALLFWAGARVQDVIVRPGAAITAGKSLRIPIDESGCFRYFISLAPEVSAVNADLFVFTRDEALAALAPDDAQRKVLAALPKSVLWIGHDDKAARRLKLPNGTPVSPAELTVRAIAAIQTARYPRPLAQQQQWIAPAATLLFCLWLTNWRKSRLWPGAFAAAVILGGFSLYLYRQDQEWMPLIPSLGILGAALVLSFLLPSRGAFRPVETSASGTRRSVSARSGSKPDTGTKPVAANGRMMPVEEPVTPAPPFEPDNPEALPAEESGEPEPQDSPETPPPDAAGKRKGKRKRRRR